MNFNANLLDKGGGGGRLSLVLGENLLFSFLPNW